MSAVRAPFATTGSERHLEVKLLGRPTLLESNCDEQSWRDPAQAICDWVL
jgi:hypothetical protein